MKRLIWISIICTIIGFTSCGGHTQKNIRMVDTIALTPCPHFVSDSALKFIQEQCQFGPRITGSEASQKCGDYIENCFRMFGATVENQYGMVTLYDGTQLKARNIVASINPDNTDRILLCSHWDSRPWADNDPDNSKHKTPILGANDGASGVAVMIELCRLMQQNPLSIGIDFVCFDAEDLGLPQWEEDRENSEETWCLGSRLWAQKAKENNYHARYGILLDMVGGYGCTFSKELISTHFAAPIVEQLWKLAKQLGYGHFFPMEEGGTLVDDHLNVNRIARIPCLDIVPYFKEGPSCFGPTWHTVNDTPKNIDPNVLEAVGQSLTQMLYNEAPQQ